ncbi:MAG: hypothetical protein GY851_34610 [bacterium]|nr:hypothetical protein [bacterium]
MKRLLLTRVVGVIDAIMGGVSVVFYGLLTARWAILLAGRRIGLSGALPDFILRLTTSVVVPLALGGLLLATGIGLLKRAPWARACAVTYGIVGAGLWPMVAVPTLLSGQTPSPVGYLIVNAVWPATWALVNLATGILLRDEEDGANDPAAPST